MRSNDLWATTGTDTEAQILEAAETILRRRLERVGKIAEPSEAGTYLRAHCAHLDHEVFGCIFLDTRHRILATEDLFRGTIDGAEVHPRVVAKRALMLNAAAIIAFHNHPSGALEPSSSDRAVTARLKQSLALLDIRLLDHIVVSAEGHTSLASRGWV
ncbi:MAG TPA: JAB domain-containing protein [Chloroflexota bacterium]|nr:JAB domain-containing protein [Chloroflexota bacterium]